MAAAETAATEKAAGGGGGADSGRVAEAATDAAAAAEREGGGNDKMKGKGSTSTHKCLGTYIEFYLCICKSLSVAQIAVPGGSAICATNRNLRIHK